MSTIVTRAGKGSPLTNTELDSNFSNLNTDKLELSGGTLTGNLNLGDNVKLQLGNQTNGDLQIYHDSNNSYIRDLGQGNLYITANEFRVGNADNSKDYIHGNNGAEVKLFHNNSQKLATTATGIDVTGDISATGDEIILDSSTQSFLKLDKGSSSNYALTRYYTAGTEEWRSGTYNDTTSYVIGTPTAKRLSITTDGDISFYNDSAAQGLFWDSSASRLGLGTTVPASTMHVNSGANGEILRVQGADAQLRINNSTSNVMDINSSGSGDSLTLSTGDTAALTINSSQNATFSGSVTSTGLTVSATGSSYPTISHSNGNRIQLQPSYNYYNAYSHIFSSLNGTTNHLTIANTGNVGIGTSSFTSAASGRTVLEVNGSSASALINLSVNGTRQGYIYTDTSDMNVYNVDSGSLNFGTANTERMKITSSGYIHMAGASDVRLTLGSQGTAGNNDANWIRGNGTSLSYNAASANHIWETGGSEKMRLTSTGLGIGTSSPALSTSWNTVLHVKSAALGAELRLADSDSGGTGDVGLVVGQYGNNSYIINKDGGTTNFWTGANGGAERARIDSSGNLLVGKTSADVATQGIVLRGGTGESYFSRTNDNPVYINRNTSDGSLISFRKDGTTVGSIGTQGGDLNIGTGACGISFVDGVPALYPWTTSGNTTRDAAIDLGDSGARFKDLYLSGYAYVGALKTNASIESLSNLTFWVPNVGEAVRIEQNTGRVGIGLTAPDAPLSVYSPSASANIKLTRAGTSENLQFGTYYINSTHNDLQLTTTTSHPMVFKTNNTERTRIASNGTLYHGKTADSLNTGGLQTLISGQTSITQSYTEPLRLNRMSTEGAIQKFYYNGAEVGSVDARGGDLVIRTGDTGIRFSDVENAIMPHHATDVIDNQIDIGFSSYRFKDLYLSNNATAQKLTLTKTPVGTYTIEVDGTSTGQPNLIVKQSTNERFRCDNNGNLLVGTTATLKANVNGLHVDALSNTHAVCVRSGGNGYGIAFQNSSGSDIGSITMDATSTTYNTTSDQRLKENIADADDAGSKIDAIQVRQYDWKADRSHQDYGMVAQELLEVAPEAVSGDADSEEMMGVDYSKLVPMLIKEIQSLRQRVAQLEE